MSTPNEQLLTLDHQIRGTEHSLAVARLRRRWSNLSLLFGPLLLLLLYALLWIPWLSRTALIAILIPGVPVVLAFCIASIYLKSTPGGPAYDEVDQGHPVSKRDSEGDLELELAHLRDQRKLLVADAGFPVNVRRITYKHDAQADIDYFRAESRRYRRVSNTLQGVLIVGSLAATGASGIAAGFPVVRWAIVGLTFVVGIASGFLGYYKYKERSFYLQQTADAVEQEWEAVELGVGRYKRLDDEEALAEFVEEVHRLKAEQRKRQQNLEQPSEGRGSDEPTA